MSRSFLLLYGVGGSGPTHWQSWLANELVSAGETVYYPDFPAPDNPDKKQWLERLAHVMAEIPETDELTVITHSLGCILWLHSSTSPSPRPVEQAILVCPPSVTLDFDPVQSFFPLPDDLSGVKKRAKSTWIIHSSNDPYCSVEDSTYYQSLGVPRLTLPNMGHINVESGHGPWPWMLDLCRTGMAPLV